MNKNYTNILLLIITITAVVYVLLDVLASERLYYVLRVYDFTPLYFIVGFVVSFLILTKLMSSFLGGEKNPNILLELLKGIFGFYSFNVEKTIDDSKVNFEIDKSEINQVVEAIKEKVEKTSNEHYFSEIKDYISKQVYIEIFQNKIRAIENRVKGEINRLSKSAIINLSLGMMLSVGGLWYLGYYVVDVQKFITIEEMFVNTFPKTIFVLLIEVFAYFFLKLYKQNLDDIKYYQNELTNIESKNLALQIAKQSNNYKLITVCIEEFLSTERNFILEKDQSTIEIEKERINSNNTNNTLQVLKDIFKNKV
ncbi:hypothetical protein NRA42_04080 [Acinetobacter baumannii]|nr:hypothetical protein [Acinetobacter baumannii]HCA5723038.1 hypothetical protein [Acinetobacter baumannii]